MAINSIGQNLATYGEIDTKALIEDKTTLDNDDFMMLLLAQLQNQDPTEPTDTGTILTQTSQLATMSAADDTNDALADLSASLSTQDQFGTISAIGKTADLGSDAIEFDKGSAAQFEIYFPQDVASGTIEVSDLEGNVVATIPIEMQEENASGEIVDLEKLDSGVYLFDWDGLATDGSAAESGIYRIESKYTNSNGDNLETRVGAYPIESVRFEDGAAFAKLGSSYIPMTDIVEIY